MKVVLTNPRAVQIYRHEGRGNCEIVDETVHF